MELFFDQFESKVARDCFEQLNTTEVMLCICACAQLCLTLCDPIDSSPPDSFVHGIVQARILEWVAISSSGLNLHLLSESPASPGRWILFHWATWEAQVMLCQFQIKSLLRILEVCGVFCLFFLVCLFLPFGALSHCLRSSD